jgi:hypothetical protein
MGYELTDYESTAIKPMLPNKTRCVMTMPAQLAASTKTRSSTAPS